MEAGYSNNLETDFLTKCFTRNGFAPFLEHQLLKAGLNRELVSVVFIDLDGFKSMNDAYGHAFGDEALKYFSSTLRLSLEEDYFDASKEVQRFIFRYGGDEFVVILLGKNTAEAQKIIAGALRNMKRRHFLYRGRQFPMTFSAGISMYPKDGNTAAELTEKADKALYFSKKHGKGKIVLFSEMGSWSLNIFVKAVLALVIAGSFVVVSAYLSRFVKAMVASSIEGVREQSRVKNIYLKSGGVLKGIIMNDSDPIEVKLIFEHGEGMVLLRKSEISKVIPVVEVPKVVLDRVNKINPIKISRIRLKSGGIIEGVITDHGDPMEISIILESGKGSILIRQSEVANIEEIGQ